MKLCYGLRQKMKKNWPLQQYIVQEKGLWRLMAGIYWDEWVPLPGRAKEMQTDKKVAAAKLLLPDEPEFRQLSWGLVSKFCSNYPSMSFMGYVEVLKKWYGDVHNTPFKELVLL